MEKLLDKKFWETVQQEYLESKKEYLCHGSSLFLNAFNELSLRNEINNIASKFLEQYSQKKEYSKPNSQVLFPIKFFLELSPKEIHEKLITVRQAFLIFAIQNY